MCVSSGIVNSISSEMFFTGLIKDLDIEISEFIVSNN
mgnify:CR=1 FL=1